MKFTFPAIYNGRSVEDVELVFKDGKVVEAKAGQNPDFLSVNSTSTPARAILGEFAIGTNFGIKVFTGNILFDEKMAGRSTWRWAAATRKRAATTNSAIHWDMICDMRQGGEIHVDGELFYKDGNFVA